MIKDDEALKWGRWCSSTRMEFIALETEGRHLRVGVTGWGALVPRLLEVLPSAARRAVTLVRG